MSQAQVNPSATATSVSVPIPVPIQTLSPIASSFQDPGKLLVSLNFPVKKDSGASFASDLATHKDLKATLDRFQYVELEQIEMRLIARAAGASCMLGATQDANSKTADFSTISGLTSSCGLTRTDMAPMIQDVVLVLHEGLSRQIKPPPANGMVPQFLFFADSPADTTTNVRLIFHFRFRGMIIATSLVTV